MRWHCFLSSACSCARTGMSEFPQFCNANSTVPLNSSLPLNTTSSSMYIPGWAIVQANDVELHLAFTMGIMVLFAVVFRVLAYLSLRFLRRKKIPQWPMDALYIIKCINKLFVTIMHLIIAAQTKKLMKVIIIIVLGVLLYYNIIIYYIFCILFLHDYNDMKILIVLLAKYNVHTWEKVTIIINMYSKSTCMYVYRYGSVCKIKSCVVCIYVLLFFMSSNIELEGWYNIIMHTIICYQGIIHNYAYIYNYIIIICMLSGFQEYMICSP